MPRWIDIHTHLNMLKDSPEETLKKAKASGVERIITIGTGPDDHETVLKIAEKLYPEVYCTLGVHPHDAKDYSDSVENFIRENCPRDEVVAVGEIGLDYYYKNSEIEVQKEVFRRQLQLSVDLNLPVEIHTRDAEEDTLSILKEFSGQVKGLIHCFTGTQSLADGALDLGLNISISGVVTFKKAQALRDVVKTVPLDRLHVETDAPFLTPVPFRGKMNTSAFVVHTAEKVAEIKSISLEELARQTNENAQAMFPKIKWN